MFSYRSDFPQVKRAHISKSERCFNAKSSNNENNVKVKKIVNFAFQNSKPTRVTRTNSTAIDHILTNAFLNN